MFSDPASFVQTASGILVLASLLGLGLMRARVVDLKERLTECREEIADQDRRLANLKAERAEDKAEILAQAASIAALGREVRTEGYWTEVGTKLDAHHTAAEAHWSADEELLGLILQAMKGRPQ